MILDTHAHYDDETFDTDRKELLGSLRDADITSVMNMAASPDSCVTTPKLAETYDWMYTAQGIYLSETTELDEEKIRRIEPRCVYEKVKAVREIGLDYYWEEPDHSIQKKRLICQLDPARRTKLPVIIHSRNATKDTLDMMKVEKARDMGDVIHYFSYGKETTREYLNMGFFLGIGDVVIFDNAKKLKEMVEHALLKSLVLGTDCPYLVPMPNRGKRNSSLSPTYVTNAISGIKGVGRDTVMKTAWESALCLYRISPTPTSDV